MLSKSQELIGAYETSKDLGRDHSVDEAVKHVLFKALKLPVAERIPYLNAETTKFEVAKQAAKNIVHWTKRPNESLGHRSPKKNKTERQLSKRDVSNFLGQCTRVKLMLQGLVADT